MEVEISAVGGVSPDSPLGARAHGREGRRRRRRRGAERVVEGPRARDPARMSRDTLELLSWISRQPRSYPEAIEVWRTNCPQHSVWEDALDAADRDRPNGAEATAQRASPLSRGPGRARALRTYVTNANGTRPPRRAPRATSRRTRRDPSREARVALDLQVDLRQQELVGERQRGGVELAAADHEHAAPRRRAGAARPRASRPAPRPRRASRVARDDDVPPPGQRAEAVGQRVPGAPPHDHRMPHGELAEARHVLRDPPREPAVAADHAAARDGGDERDLHTAIGRADRRVVLVADDLEVLERVLEDRGRPAAKRSVGYGYGLRASCVSTCSRWLS